MELTPETFSNAIKKNNYFVMFFAPWCGHCKRLHPTWEQLAEMMNVKEDPLLIVAKVDCTKYQQLCTENKVSGYPTLKFFKLGTTEPTKFHGSRDLPTITAFIQEQLGDNEEPEDVDAIESTEEFVLAELTDETFKKHISKGQHFVKFYAPWCGHCQRLAPTWKRVAEALRDQNVVKISQIDCTQYRPICSEFKVAGYPTLLWIEDGQAVQKYTDSRDFHDLVDFIVSMSGYLPESFKIPRPTLPSALLTVTENNFDELIKKDFVVVVFYITGDESGKALDLLEQVAYARKEITIGKIDCFESKGRKVCAEEGVANYPNVSFYSKGKKLVQYFDIEDYDALVSWIDSYVEKVKDTSQEEQKDDSHDEL